jgi:hypothetical protein
VKNVGFRVLGCSTQTPGLLALRFFWKIIKVDTDKLRNRRKTFRQQKAYGIGICVQTLAESHGLYRHEQCIPLHRLGEHDYLRPDHTTSSIVLPRLLRPRLLFLRSEVRMMSAVMLEARIGSLEAFVAIWVLTIVLPLLDAMLVPRVSL